MAETEGLEQFEEAVQKVMSQVEELLMEDHLGDLRATYEKNPGKLVGSLIFRLAPSKKKGVIDVETRLSFVSERIKDSKKGTAGDPQGTIEFAGEEHHGLEQRQEGEAEQPLPGDPDQIPGVQPNEFGVFVVEPLLGYHGGTKPRPCEAFIHLVEYEDRWYESIRFELSGARGGGNLPSVQCESYDTLAEAFDVARGNLLDVCEDLIQWFPTRKADIKRMLAWSEALTMQDVESAMEELGEAPAHEPALRSSLADHIAFMAERFSGENVDPGDAGEWFGEIVARVVEEHYPRYSYIDPENVLEMVLDDTLANFQGGEDEDPDNTAALRTAIATEYAAIELVGNYIEKNDLRPTTTEGAA